MDQLIFASLSHTHYWYEVGMLKVRTVGYPCMAINGIVQYTSGFLPDILLLFTQAPILVWFDGTIIDIFSMYYSVYVGLCLVALHGD